MKNKTLNNREFLRPNEIQAVYGIAKSTLYKMMKDSNFPAPLRPSNKITLISKVGFEEYLRNKQV